MVRGTHEDKILIMCMEENGSGMVSAGWRVLEGLSRPQPGAQRTRRNVSFLRLAASLTEAQEHIERRKLVPAILI
jgi:hypothetical protein